MSVVDEAPPGPLALVCGGGSLPFAVADSVLAGGRGVVLFGIEGITDAARIESYPHHWFKLAQAGHLFSLMRKEGCRDIVFIGAVTRPPFWRVRFDWTTIRMLPALLAAYRGGDNHLLQRGAAVFERHGFHVVGAHEVAPQILLPEGYLTRHAPSPAELDDIALGVALLHAMGPFDVGQAVVVADRHILAVEGVEGTDEMLARVADLRRRGRLHVPQGRGVLVKVPKPGQDRRLDLPAIGPKTVEAAAAAGLAGIAAMARETVVAELQATIAAADRLGLFVSGVKEAP
jgi:DUF1009 family protein